MAPSTLEVAQARWNTQLDELSQGWADLPVDWQMVRSEVLEVCRTTWSRRGPIGADVTLETIRQQLLDQLSLRMSASIWTILPNEVVDYILECVLPSISKQPSWRVKRILSTLSLVCKRWSLQCRPFLFHRLILTKPSDPYTLSTILSSPRSSWLRGHIKWVTFKQVGSISNPESSKSLRVGVVPHLGQVSYAYQNKTGGKGPLVPIILRTLWGNKNLPLTSLHLEWYRFHSLSTLLRLVSALRYLESLEMYRVTWAGSSGPDSLECTSDFGQIRRIRIRDCQEGWPFGWIFAAASTGHKYKFLRDGDEGPPANVRVIVRICQLFKADGYRATLFQAQEPTEEGEYIFSVRLADDDGNTSPRRGLELVMITRPAKALGGSPSAQLRALHRLVISVSSDVPFDKVTEFNWSELDTILSEARHLESLEILCGSTLTAEQIDALSTDLPQRMPKSAVKLRYTAKEADPTTLEPVLFKRDVWSSQAASVFAIDGMGSLLSAPKYVRL